MKERVRYLLAVILICYLPPSVLTGQDKKAN